MAELDKARQQAIAHLVRRWIKTEAFRRHLRQLLGLRIDHDLPQEHRSLLEELRRKYSEWSHGPKVRTEKRPQGVDGGRPKDLETR
ncbi:MULTISPECIES: hypothetical protein [unclassified Mesorhizobium]|uniref:hypothetical protein n=1 Tax=unclassified Mesorhizobium TaxID=325217 RepID=UPI0015E2D28F|nr:MULTISPECIES: hypothetical protein [unclassified Mesorhizobium]MCA0024518.1 hypothetical protein [Mesorhizobium sp. B263B1A]